MQMGWTVTTLCSLGAWEEQSHLAHALFFKLLSFSTFKQRWFREGARIEFCFQPPSFYHAELQPPQPKCTWLGSTATFLTPVKATSWKWDVHLPC